MACRCSATPSAAAAWLAQRGIQVLAGRRAAAELARGNRQRAMGIIAATTLGRVWLMVTAALLVGLAEREAGLAAAVLLVALFTVSFAAQGIAHLLEPEGTGGAMSEAEQSGDEDAHQSAARPSAATSRSSILLRLIFGSTGKRRSVPAAERVQARPWISIHIGGIDLSINKAVLYLVLASALTIGMMTWISRRMAAEAEPGADGGRGGLRPDPQQHHRRQPRPGRGWPAGSPSCAALFFFIWFSNMIGFLPLPINTEHTVDIFGVAVPTFAIYAATANLSIPLVLTLSSGSPTTSKGSAPRASSRYLTSWLPPGLEDMSPFGKGAIFVIEAISHFVRLISLSVRLFANILAGHLLILFMGGGLAVLLGHRRARRRSPSRWPSPSASSRWG